MQIVKDGNGAIIMVHKITGNFAGKVSGYFSNGQLVDGEQKIGSRCRPIRMNGPIWNTIIKNTKHLFNKNNEK